MEAEYLYHGISSDTRRAYESIILSFISFGRVRGWPRPFFPTSSAQAATWIANEANLVVREGKALYKKTLQRKITALASYHVDLGMPTEQLYNKRIDRVIKGANRFHGVVTKKQPSPITLPVLRSMVQAMRVAPLDFGGHVEMEMLCAVFTLAFACFLRAGEFTYSEFDPRFHFQRSSVKLSENGPSTITLKSSKTDQERRGVTIVIPRGPPDICPVRALQRWLFATFLRSEDAPLFDFHGRPFTKQIMVGYMEKALRRAGYVAKDFTGHSFRRGAATWASAIGTPTNEIQILGRWNSDCFKLYIDAGPESHHKAGERLLFTDTVPTSLDARGLPKAVGVWRPAL